MTTHLLFEDRSKHLLRHEWRKGKVFQIGTRPNTLHSRCRERNWGDFEIPWEICKRNEQFASRNWWGHSLYWMGYPPAHHKTDPKSRKAKTHHANTDPEVSSHSSPVDEFNWRRNQLGNKPYGSHKGCAFPVVQEGKIRLFSSKQFSNFW